MREIRTSGLAGGGGSDVTRLPYYLVGRLLQTVVLLLVVSMISFLLITQAPGGPAILLDPNMSAEDAARMKALLGLDQPVTVQYWRWLLHVVRGNLGVSLSLGRPVLKIILRQLPNTLLLSSVALGLAILTAVPVGIASAARRHSATDHVATFVAFFGVSIPVFWYGLMLILLFSVRLGWFPAGGMRSVDGAGGWLDVARHLVLPTVVLATANVAQLVRYTRSAMISVLREDYIRTARAKGVADRIVLYRHALKNAMIPVVTVIGLLIPRLVGGAAVTETVFAWPGMGLLAVRAAFERDYPMIMGVTMAVSVVVVFSSLLVDLLYVYLDPRIRYE